MSVLSYFRAFVRGRPGIVTLTIVLWMAQSVAEVLPGPIMKGFFDAVEREAFAHADRAIMLLLAFAAGFSGVVMATAIVSTRLRFHVSNSLRRGILNALLEREASAGSYSIGSALATARDDPMAPADTVASFVDQISIVVFAIVALVLMARIDLLITLVAIAPIVTVVGVSQLTRGTVEAFRTRSRQASVSAAGFMVHALSAWKTIQLGGAQKAVVRRLTRLDGERSRSAIRDGLLERSVAASFHATSTIGTGLVLIVAGAEMGAGGFSIGDFALFAYYLTLLAEFSAELGGLLLQYRQAKVAWRRIVALSGSPDRKSWSDATKPFRLDEEPTTPPERLQALRLSDLTVQASRRGGESSPRSGAGISLEFRPGELVAITGRVGAGKTTLLKAMLGLIPVECGEISWNARAVRELGSFFRFPTCTYVSQEPRLFSVSIRENVALEPDVAEDDVRSAAVGASLQAAALAQDVERLPEGAATVVGAAGARLSGGQRQRLAAARAFYHGAPVIVLDDPCSALDPDTEREFLDNVKRMVRTGALCLVTGTNRALLMAADRIVVLREGAVEAVGTLPELLSSSAEAQLLWDSVSGRQ